LLGTIISLWLCKSIPVAPPPLSRSQSLSNIEIIFHALLEDKFPETDLGDGECSWVGCAIAWVNPVSCLCTARAIAGGNESHTLDLTCRLLLHYHCTFGGRSYPLRSFHEDLLQWLKIALQRSSIDLTGQAWTDTPLLSELLCHCCPHLRSVVTGSMDKVMEVAERHLDVPRLFAAVDLRLSHWQAQFLLQIYLAFFVRPSSPAQRRLELWVSHVTSHQSSPTTTLSHLGAPPTQSPPTQAPPTKVSSSEVKLTKAPPTKAPPTKAPPTKAPPTKAPPTKAPPTPVPPPDSCCSTDVLPCSVCPCSSSSSASGSGSRSRSGSGSGSGVSLCSSAWDSGQLLCDTLNAVTCYTLPQLNPPPAGDPKSLVKLAFSLAQRHFDICRDFQVEQFLQQVFPRLVVLEKLNTYRNVSFKPHKSAFLSVRSLSDYHLVRCATSIAIDYYKTIPNSHPEGASLATPVGREPGEPGSLAETEQLSSSELTRKRSSLSGAAAWTLDLQLPAANTNSKQRERRVDETSLRDAEEGNKAYDWDKLKVSVQEASGTSRPLFKKAQHCHDYLEVSYFPKKVGSHKIAVDYDGKAIVGSPLTFQVFDPSQCKLVTPATALESTCLVGEKFSLTVDTSTAGPGHITATNELLSHTLATPSSDVSSGLNLATELELAELRDDVTSVSLKLQQEGTHRISIYYNGILAENVRAQVKCVPVRGADMPLYPSINNNTFLKLVSRLPPEAVHALVEGPEGEQLAVSCLGPYNYSYTAGRVGLHTVRARAGQLTAATYKVYHSNPQLAELCRITSQPGGEMGVVSITDTCQYEVNCEGAGPGRLHALARRVPGGEEVEMIVTAANSLFAATFKPPTAGLYRIHLQWNGQSITGHDGLKLVVCDFSKCKVRSYGIKQAVVHRETHFSVEAPSFTVDDPLPVTVNITHGRTLASSQHNNTWR